jgi:hypothetical protein
MISRKTAMAIAQAYTAKFSYLISGSRPYQYQVERNELYDFLYENEYQGWFCNASKGNFDRRSLQEWFLRIHTGETLAAATKEWSWKKRQALGQQYLALLARDFLVFYEENCHHPGIVGSYRKQYEVLLRTDIEQVLKE